MSTGPRANVTRALFASLAAVLVTSLVGCGGDSSSEGTDADLLPGERSDRELLDDGAVHIDLQSSSPTLTDTLELDVSAAGDDVNASSLFAECSLLGDGSRERAFRVGVTDLRRLADGRPVISVELTSTKRVSGPGRYPVQLLLVDREQRQRQLSGRMTIAGAANGTFSVTGDQHTQVRGSFGCGPTLQAATPTTAPRNGTATLTALRVEVRGARRGSVEAAPSRLDGVDAADAGGSDHCTGVVEPRADRYVVRVTSTGDDARSGGLRSFELIAPDATAEGEAPAIITARFDDGAVVANGLVTFGRLRTGGKFSGHTDAGEGIQATFRCAAA